MTILLLLPSCKAILIKHVFNSYNARTGITFPDLVATNELGKKVNLDTLSGKSFYFNLWGTWCPACIQDIPYINKLVESLKNHPDIVVVNLCVKSDMDAWENMIRDKPLLGVNLIINEDSTYNKLEKLFNMEENGYPYFLIVGKNRKVLGSNIEPDQGLLLTYALLQAGNGVPAKVAAYQFMDLARRMKKKDDPETRAFILFLEEFGERKP